MAIVLGLIAATPANPFKGPDAHALDSCGYPITTANPRTAVVFNESTILRTAWIASDANGTHLVLLYNDEYAMISKGNNISDPKTSPTDPQGRQIGGGGQKLTARDMVRFGQLWLQNGRWGDRQLVPARYVGEATKAQSEGGPPGGTRYGYGWWITSSPQGYEAIGYGGQTLLVVPSLDLVVVTAADVAGQTNVSRLLYEVVNAVDADA